MSGHAANHGRRKPVCRCWTCSRKRRRAYWERALYRYWMSKARTEEEQYLVFFRCYPISR